MGAATRKQIGRVHACLGALGVTDREQKLRILSAVVYRPITTSNELTFDEAHVVIDTLENAAGKDDPAAWLAELTAVAGWLP